jgi:class 3 adenylate cyclase/Tol biopolymer transport system component
MEPSPPQGALNAEVTGEAPRAADEHLVALTRGFLFADLRGYTAYVESRGDPAGAALLDRYRALVRDTVARFGGAEIKTEGDSFYVVFPSASSAVACGLAIVEAARAAAAAEPDRPIRVGIGIHAGESVEGAEGYVGSAVNIAARICAQAAAGEVLVSETVRSLTRTSGRLLFAPRGRRRLKGIAEPVALYRVGTAGATDPASARRLGSRSSFALGGVAVAALLVVGALAASGAIGRGDRSSPSGAGLGLATPSASPEVVERIAYTATYANPGDEPRCEPYDEGHLTYVSPGGDAIARATADGDLWQTHAAWAPDGSRLAYIGIDQKDQASLRVVAADGSGDRAVLPAAPGDVEFTAERSARPSWSRGGDQLLFTYGIGGVWIVNADGSGLRRLLAPPAPPAQPTADPDGNVPEVFGLEFGTSAWTPDGRISVLVTAPSADPKVVDAVTTVYTAAADGSGLAPLDGLPENVSIADFAWNADGRLALIGLRPRSSEEQPAIYDLYVAGAGGGPARRLPASTETAAGVAWSPDGARLAFGGKLISTIGADGTGQATLATPSDQAACWPSWTRTTVAALPQPTPTLAPGTTPGPQAFHRGRLPAGRYETAVFEPRFAFNVGGGWVGLVNYVDAFGAGHPGTPFGEIDGGRIQVVYETPCLDAPTRLIGPSAREFIAFLQEHPYLKTSDPKAIIVGGRGGLAIDITVARALVPADCPGSPLANDPEHPVWKHEYLFDLGGGSVWLRLNDRVRILSIDSTSGPALTFVVESSPEDYDTFLPMAQEVLDSLAFP